MILRGELTTLRPIAKEDLARLHRWLNDPDVMQWWDGRDHPATFDRVEARFRKSIDGADREAHRYMIDVERDGETHTVGMMQHGKIHPRARNVQIDVLIGETTFRDSGFGTDALRVLLKHLFDDLKVHRVWHTIRSLNVGAMRAAEKIGFVKEGVLREHDQLEGKWVDVVVYGMLVEDWRVAT
ncbi:MAG: GNAT family N-acetyltransferase [Polyangiales bacterium]